MIMTTKSTPTPPLLISIFKSHAKTCVSFIFHYKKNIYYIVIDLPKNINIMLMTHHR